MRASPLVCANRALLKVLTTMAGPASQYIKVCVQQACFYACFTASVRE